MPIIRPVCLRRSVAALAALDVKTPSPALLPCGRRRAGETKRQSGSQPGLPPLPAGIPVGAWSTRSGTQCRCLSPLSFVVVAAPSHGAVFSRSLGTPAGLLRRRHLSSAGNRLRRVEPHVLEFPIDQHQSGIFKPIGHGHHNQSEKQDQAAESRHTQAQEPAARRTEPPVDPEHDQKGQRCRSSRVPTRSR